MSEYKPRGLFIEEDENGRFIYSDFLTDGGYLINRSDYKKYRTYSMRFVLAVIAGVLVSTFIEAIWPCLIVFAVTLISGELLFRFKFLKNCTSLPRYLRKKKPLLDFLTGSTRQKHLLLKAAGFTAIGVLMVINAYLEKYQGILLISSWIVGVLAVLLAIAFVIAHIKGKGEQA